MALVSNTVKEVIVGKAQIEEVLLDAFDVPGAVGTEVIWFQSGSVKLRYLIENVEVEPKKKSVVAKSTTNVATNETSELDDVPF